MLILDTATRTLEFKLGGAVTTNELPFVASYVELTTTSIEPKASHGVSAGATNVVIMPAPAASKQHQLKSLHIPNIDTAAVSLILLYKDGATERRIAPFALAVGDVLQYTDGEGFRIFDLDGNLKMTGGGGGGASLTVEESDGAPSVASVVKIKFAQGDGLTVTDEGGGIARINVSAAAAPDQDARLLAWLLGGAD